jgi:hypothetical protein
MNDKYGEMSSVPLMTNEDVDELLNELEWINSIKI